jgi:hypothetical protein
MPAKLDHFRGFFGRMGRKTWRTRRDSGKSRFEGSGQPACILSLLATFVDAVDAELLLAGWPSASTSRDMVAA